MPSISRCYRILGLPPSAPVDDVKRAYRDLAKVWHPDRFAGDERLQKKAQDNLKRINEAYDRLKWYTPPPGGARPSRLSGTFSAILDLGDMVRSSVSGFRISELREGDPLRGPEPPHGPKGFTVVGLGPTRSARRRKRVPVVSLVTVIVAVAGVVIAILLVLL